MYSRDVEIEVDNQVMVLGNIKKIEVAAFFCFLSL